MTARHLATGALLGLLAVALGLAHTPLEIGAIRIAGVSALWWYVTAVAPALAIVLAALAARRRS